MKILSLILLFLIPFGIQAQTNGISISTIEPLDYGELSEDANSSASIDVVQGLCGISPSQTAEPFYDTLVRIKVRNDLDSTVRFSRFHYSVPKPYGANGRINSAKLALVGGNEAAPDEVTVLYALFLDVKDSSKVYAGHSTAIPDDLGFRNVTFRLIGKTSLGKKIRISKRSAISFDDFDRCSN